MNLKKRILLGNIRRFLSPHFGSCERCGRTWNYAENHNTNFTQLEGCFPLCEDCWSELIPETRLPFYKELWISWCSRNMDDNGRDWNETWKLIETAVMEGK